MAVSTAVGVIPTTDLNLSATIRPRKLVGLSPLYLRRDLGYEIGATGIEPMTSTVSR